MFDKFRIMLIGIITTLLISISLTPAYGVLVKQGDYTVRVPTPNIAIYTQRHAHEQAPEPEPEPEPNYAPGNTVWDRLAECESGGDWSINTGNGFYGGLQFTLKSWRWVGGSGYPHRASRAEQIKRAKLLLDKQGWGAWPACSRKLGLR